MCLDLRSSLWPDQNEETTAFFYSIKTRVLSPLRHRFVLPPFKPDRADARGVSTCCANDLEAPERIECAIAVNLVLPGPGNETRLRRRPGGKLLILKDHIVLAFN